MRNEAKKSNLSREDLKSIIDKLEDVKSEAEIVGLRPRRQAAIVAAQMRQQMIEDNALWAAYCIYIYKGVRTSGPGTIGPKGELN